MNGGFYLADERFPVLYTLLALVGLAGRGWLAERGVAGRLFLLFFGIYLLFYAGSYNYGADVRYSLMTYPPMAVLAALAPPGSPGSPGCCRGARTAGRDRRRCCSVPLVRPLVRATTEEAWAARADVRFARSVAPELPPNSYVLTHNPGMFHVWGVNAGQMSLGGNPLQLPTWPSATRRRLLHWNFWCNVQDPVQQGYCRSALGAAPWSVREYRERDQRFALYRLTLPARPRP